MGVVVRMLRNNFGKLRDALPEVADDITHELIDIAYEISQELVPVLTGELKESGRVEKIPSGYRLIYDARNKNDVSYAGFVEFGTSRNSAQPYVTPAMEYVRSIRPTNIEARLNEHI